MLNRDEMIMRNHYNIRDEYRYIIDLKDVDIIIDSWKKLELMQTAMIINKEIFKSYSIYGYFIDRGILPIIIWIDNSYMEVRYSKLIKI